MSTVNFFRNMGNYKVLEFGTAINKEMVYTKNSFNEFTIHHIQTGMRICSDKKLKVAKEKAFHLFESNKEVVEKRLREVDLKSLPTKEEMYSIERELQTTLKLKELPIDSLIYTLKGLMTIDFVRLDNILESRKGYNYDLSLNDNIINMYGSRVMSLLNKYEIAF